MCVVCVVCGWVGGCACMCACVRACVHTHIKIFLSNLNFSLRELLEAASDITTYLGVSNPVTHHTIDQLTD